MINNNLYSTLRMSPVAVATRIYLFRTYLKENIKVNMWTYFTYYFHLLVKEEISDLLEHFYNFFFSLPGETLPIRVHSSGQRRRENEGWTGGEKDGWLRYFIQLIREAPSLFMIKDWREFLYGHRRLYTTRIDVSHGPDAALLQGL